MSCPPILTPQSLPQTSVKCLRHLQDEIHFATDHSGVEKRSGTVIHPQIILPFSTYSDKRKVMHGTHRFRWPPQKISILHVND